MSNLFCDPVPAVPSATPVVATTTYPWVIILVGAIGIFVLIVMALTIIYKPQPQKERAPQSENQQQQTPKQSVISDSVRNRTDSIKATTE